MVSIITILTIFYDMKDHYQTLGVDRKADAAEIKKAYRKLASKHHPDKGGDKTVFQEIQAAYDTLSDDKKRAMYDNPGVGGFNNEHNFGFRQDAPFDFESIFNMFGTRFQHPNQQRRAPAQVRMSLWLQLKDVAEGGRKTVSIGSQHGTQTVEIEIPTGIGDGDAVQYSGIGPGGSDLVVIFRIHPDPRFERRELNIYANQAINIWDLILGGEVIIRDLLGNELSLTVPARTQPGTTFRLRGHGLKDRYGNIGDLMVRTQATIPDNISPELLDAIKQNRAQ
jgi:DnaJ-class molecular chaperone